MGGERKMSFVNVVKNRDGIEVDLESLSQEERQELSEFWTDRFMQSLGYVKKKEDG